MFMMKVHQACYFHFICILLFVDVHTTFAQTTMQAENDSQGTIVTPTCETGASACGTVANDVDSVDPLSSTVQSVTPTSLLPPVSTMSIEKSTLKPTKMQDMNSSSFPPSAKPASTHKLLDEHPPINNGICSCDLMAYLCDINCCCDPDCSAFDRQSFSKCIANEYPLYENRFCSATKLLFANNSEYLLQQSDNGMFCIVRSNIAGSVYYPHRSGVYSQEEFLRQWKLSRPSTWPIPLPSKPFEVKTDESYVEGSPLWVLRGHKMLPYDLPAPSLTSACSYKKKIKFLQSWSSQCIRKAPQTLDRCQNAGLLLYQEVFNVVKSPRSFNLTSLLSKKSPDCPLDICTQVHAFLCSKSYPSKMILSKCKEISKVALLNMSYVESDVCYGVVKNMRLVFSHNGTEGLKQISAYFVLSNVSMKENSLRLRQQFSLEFSWASVDLSKRNSSDNITHQTNATINPQPTPFARSGNPGYIAGKPIQAGFRLQQRAEFNDTSDASVANSELIRKDERIEIRDDPHQWLTLPGSDSNGGCDASGYERTVVTFGYDLHLSCGVRITQNNLSSELACKTLRQTMLNILFGNVATVLNASQLSDWSRMVAAFGNANMSNPQEWVPLLLDRKSLPLIDDSLSQQQGFGSKDHVCMDVPLGIHIYIMHGLVGAVSNPQAKIIGALVRVDPVHDISWNCISPVCFEQDDSRHLRVVSSVVFVDVSSPAVTRFAEPPAVHIRIPPDFFYPFLSSGTPSVYFMFSLYCELLICTMLYVAS